MAERRYVYMLPREISRLENVGVTRRIILKWICQKSDEVWPRFIYLRIEAGFCKRGEKPSGSIKCGGI
jgi:hypothetical protein